MAKWRYPSDLSPSRLLLLAAHQIERDMGDLGDVRPLLDQMIAGRVPIDCSPEARAALDLAILKAADRKQGILRLYPDELRLIAADL